MRACLTIRVRLLIAVLFSFVFMLGLAQAQDDPVTLLSPDPAYPVQFQPLAPDSAPSTAAFTSRLNIPARTEQPIIYIILENTGWSEGTLGLISLPPDDRYVALEVQPDGTPLEGGLAFALEAAEALDGETPGYLLHVLIAQKQTFAIYRVVDEAGVTVAGQTNVRTQDVVSPEAVEHLIDPEPVLGPVVLEFHIVAHAIPSAPPPPASSTTGTGGWGACGSCDTCGQAGECVLSPDGQCKWDPQTCGRSASSQSGGNSGGGASQPASGGGECVKQTAECTGGYTLQICPDGHAVMLCNELTDNCGNKIPGPVGPSCN